MLLDETNKTLSEKTTELSKSKNDLEKRLEEESKKSSEIQQEKIILEEISQREQKSVQKLSRKFYVTISVIAVAVAGGFITYSTYENQILLSLQVQVGNYNSPFLIQDLKGNVVNTWISWKLASGQTLNVNIENDANVTPDKLYAVKNAILSTESVTLDDSLFGGSSGSSSVYYEGWEGALAVAGDKDTRYYIPQHFKMIDDPNGAGDITIKLTNDLDTDGLSGYTHDIADGNQILKSTITIYNAGQLSAQQLGAITRHEFGHAMGLAHSTASTDLMHPTIQTNYPYISSCDIQAVSGLYNGDKQSQVICR